jgi:hypothetical protein
MQGKNLKKINLVGIRRQSEGEYPEWESVFRPFSMPFYPWKMRVKG